MADNQSIIGRGAIFKGKISNASTIEINGRVDADIKSDKVTLGKNATLEGSITSELVVISGNYQGKIKADSVWLTDSSVITGEINYKSLQMDRGAALNCKIIHNWDERKLKGKKAGNIDDEAIEEDN
ncbi:polymer-forming cytoskeletal protein [Alphaproteobacteria bacterium]|jgi:cytoskeletal protein CcmA (bactofilin family)|nr:polymer-forming cytoskeletal protein [Alphaproteobacteria bacterium]|tara:strand:- start:817 stop:1197 length:381 start_codon:yes stop_codon:yes gene_type:complete